ncbi:hypothetical protein GY45DRAFT_1371712 [Cubamyces sp. BRFM 1775]|nr:hypothetical protein GY45DRAFT_1371712 [Cubamyces sp. BRFM 1775]
MSAPATQACAIVIHPPTFPMPTSPPTIHSSLATIAKIWGVRCSEAQLNSGTLVPAFPPLAIPADKYLLPPGASLTRRRRKAKKGITTSSRGRRLPDPWKLIDGPAPGQQLLVPVHHPDDGPIVARQVALAPFAALAQINPPRGERYVIGTLVFYYNHARWIPFYETAFWIALAYVYLSCTVIPLLF